MSARYFHGGVPGLKLGDYLLPPSATGSRVTLLAAAREAGLALPARADRVYVTTDINGAVLYATLYPTKTGGWIYAVEPEGELTPDPDCTQPGLSWECPRARILAAWELSPAQVRYGRRLLARGRR